MCDFLNSEFQISLFKCLLLNIGICLQRIIHSICGVVSQGWTETGSDNPHQYTILPCVPTVIFPQTSWVVCVEDQCLQSPWWSEVAMEYRTHTQVQVAYKSFSQQRGISQHDADKITSSQPLGQLAKVTAALGLC